MFEAKTGEIFIGFLYPNADICAEMGHYQRATSDMQEFYMAWQLQPEKLFSSSLIVPVMVIDDVEQALPMANALSKGGINVFEITLRTPAALDAIRAIGEAFPDALVGAGTVLTPEQYEQALAAGARFIVSPGATQRLLEHGQQGAIPLIPGVCSASEIMQAMDAGYRYLKFFPAEASGGAKALKALSAPLPNVRFCPTGGIDAHNLAAYLALDCVVGVGGSWMLPHASITAGNWPEITELTRDALTLARSLRA